MEYKFYQKSGNKQEAVAQAINYDYAVKIATALMVLDSNKTYAIYKDGIRIRNM